MSTCIARWLLKKGVISNSDYELYEYAIFCILFTLFPLIMVLIISSLMDMMASGIALVVPFLLIRKFSGGFHFKSPTLCFFASIILLASFLQIILFVQKKSLFTPYFIFVILATIIICLRSPIDSAERNLSLAEVQLFKRIVLILSLMNCFLVILFLLVERPQMSISLGGSQILTAILQLPCITKQTFLSYVNKHTS